MLHFFCYNNRVTHSTLKMAKRNRLFYSAPCGYSRNSWGIKNKFTLEKQGKKKVSFSVRNSLCVSVTAAGCQRCAMHPYQRLRPARANLCYSPPLLCNSHHESDFCQYFFLHLVFRLLSDIMVNTQILSRSWWCKHVKEGPGPG